jgi:hypothetical protein
MGLDLVSVLLPSAARCHEATWRTPEHGSHARPDEDILRMGMALHGNDNSTMGLVLKLEEQEDKA